MSTATKRKSEEIASLRGMRDGPNPPRARPVIAAGSRSGSYCFAVVPASTCSGYLS